MFKIVKSTVKAVAMAIFPIIGLFYCLARALDGWRGMWICVRSNDAQ